jgi:hypothetical protein
MIELNRVTKQEMLAPFQAAEVRVRTQPYVAAYVTARVVMTRLDEALPWQWSFKLIDHWFDDKGVMHQSGVIKVLLPDGRELEFEDRGMAGPDVGKGQLKQSKHAVSDCFKRCAVHLGVGRYLYELTGVQALKIPKANLEKALAAVGYAGAWDDRHHGSIGGIREADEEDDYVPHNAPNVPTPAKEEISSLRGAEGPKTGNRPSMPPPTQASAPTTITEELLASIRKAVAWKFPSVEKYVGFLMEAFFENDESNLNEEQLIELRDRMDAMPLMPKDYEMSRRSTIQKLQREVAPSRFADGPAFNEWVMDRYSLPVVLLPGEDAKEALQLVGEMEIIS